MEASTAIILDAITRARGDVETLRTEIREELSRVRDHVGALQRSVCALEAARDVQPLSDKARAAAPSMGAGALSGAGVVAIIELVSKLLGG